MAMVAFHWIFLPMGRILPVVLSTRTWATTSPLDARHFSTYSFFSVVRVGLPAGAAYERGKSGRLAAARIYDDVDPPAD